MGSNFFKIVCFRLKEIYFKSKAFTSFAETIIFFYIIPFF